MRIGEWDSRFSPPAPPGEIEADVACTITAKEIAAAARILRLHAHDPLNRSGRDRDFIAIFRNLESPGRRFMLGRDQSTQLISRLKVEPTASGRFLLAQEDQGQEHPWK